MPFKLNVMLSGHRTGRNEKETSILPRSLEAKEPVSCQASMQTARIWREQKSGNIPLGQIAFRVPTYSIRQSRPPTMFNGLTAARTGEMDDN